MPTEYPQDKTETQNMGEQQPYGEREDQEEPKTKGYQVTGALNAKGREYKDGDIIELTEEEYEALKGVEANVEGVERKSDAQRQKEHREWKEEQAKKREEDEKAAQEKRETEPEEEDDDEDNSEEEPKPV